MDLTFCPSLFVALIDNNIFALMQLWVVQLTNEDAITVAATPLGVGGECALDFLSSIHDEAMTHY